MIEWPIRIYNTKGGQKGNCMRVKPWYKERITQKVPENSGQPSTETTRKKKIGYSWKTMAIFDYFSMEINRSLKSTPYTLKRCEVTSLGCEELKFFPKPSQWVLHYSRR